MILAIILFIIAILGLIAYSRLKKDTSDEAQGIAYILKIVVVILIVLGLIVTGFSCIATVSAGHVGVLDTFGDVSSGVLYSGLKFKNPFSNVVEMSTQTMEIKETSTVPSKEGLIIDLEISILFKIDPEKANSIYKTIGINYADVVIVPQLRSIVREITAMFEAKALYTEARDNITVLIFDRLQPFLATRGIILENVLLRDLGLPTTVTNAIEAKLKAEQEAQQMSFVLQKETQEAQRKVIEAQGIADAQEIIHQSLTPAYLTWYWISHIKDSNAVYYVPVSTNGIPNPIMTIPIGK